MGFVGLICGGSRCRVDARMMADNLHKTNPHMLSSPFFLPVKPKMEDAGEMNMMGQNFGPGVPENGSGSGSDNIEVGSGDYQNTTRDKPSSSSRKRYHRHSSHQIQELEVAFKENPHPDEKVRLELGKRLKLESKQVKFWFQNRRTHLKTQIERHENSLLKQENDKLRIANIAMREALRNPICNKCGGPAALGEVSVEEHQLRLDNARLREELDRIHMMANRFLGRPISSVVGSMPAGDSDLELAVGRNVFGGGLSSVGSSFPIGPDFGSVGSSALPFFPITGSSVGMADLDVSVDKSMYLELAATAMDELLKLAQTDNPLWFGSLDGCGEALNLEEYTKIFPPCIGMKPHNFTTEATRATGTVTTNSMSVVEMLMDLNRWTEIFSCMIGRTYATDVVSCGDGGTKDGTLQLMQAEFQLISPLVPVRQVKFLRFCKQHSEGLWAVVDVSVDSIRQGPISRALGNCRRLPSGCIVQEMPNGYSKVTWVEHMEYDDNNVHQFYRPLLRSGLAFGAQKWVATLERQCESLAVIMSSTVPDGDQAAIYPSSRRSFVKLAQRMTRTFFAGVCGTMHNWQIVQVGDTDDARLMIRKSTGDIGEPNGVILSAAATVWMPVAQQCVFEFLQNEQTRSQWDVLFHEDSMQQIVHIAKGQDLGNHISLYRSSAAGSKRNQTGMLILQEACTDVSGSLIVYAAVDAPAMNVVMSGGDSSCVVLLPSGFAIVPDCYPESSGPSNSSGSLLTVGFQILVNSVPAATLSAESIETVKTLIRHTLQGIKSALQCN